MALPGKRALTDEDIREVMGEAVDFYTAFCKEYVVPEEIRPEVFRCIHTLVGQRETQMPLVSLPGLEGKLH